MRRIRTTIALAGSACALALFAGCGGDDATSPSALGTFDGAYTLTVGSRTYVGNGTDYVEARDRHVTVVASADGCTVRLDFDYRQEGRPASEVTSAGLLGFGMGDSCLYVGADLGNAPNRPLPKVVVRNGRNEIDDGALSGTVGVLDKAPVAE